MKKIFTLLFFVGTAIASFAQNNHRHNNNDRNSKNDQYDVALNNQRYRYNNNRNFYDHKNYFPAREREYKIDQINRSFDYKINAIRNNRYMRRHEKKVAIRNAENERARQIQIVNARFISENHNGNGKHDKR
ncbi:MAG: hypothetical protein Q8891_16505 [Bacteroidota bacterium]|nr:hypothetical protein [Bacteroidota bacterium]